jgi:hypothetical protein
LEHRNRVNKETGKVKWDVWNETCFCCNINKYERIIKWNLRYDSKIGTRYETLGVFCGLITGAMDYVEWLSAYRNNGKMETVVQGEIFIWKFHAANTACFVYEHEGI